MSSCGASSKRSSVEPATRMPPRLRAPPERSNCPQHRKKLAGQALSQVLIAGLADVSGVDARARRAAAHRRGHAVDLLERACNDRLDRPVTAVAHPTGDAPLAGLVLDERAKPDTLHASAHDDAPDDRRAHRSSTTANLAGLAPPGAAQRASAFV